MKIFNTTLLSLAFCFVLVVLVAIACLNSGLNLVKPGPLFVFVVCVIGGHRLIVRFIDEWNTPKSTDNEDKEPPIS